MRLIILICFFIFSKSLYALQHFETQIKDIDMGEVMSDEVLVFLANGRVAKLSPVSSEILQELKTYKEKHSIISISLNEERQIVSMKLLKDSKEEEENKTQAYPLSSGVYVPTIIPGINLARGHFLDARKNEKESQCFNRAHVWAFEWRTKQKIYSSKVWLFFTRRYIRRFNFEWWFHVSPYFHVYEDSGIREKVMDVKYARGPISIQRWTDIFIRNNASCPVVKTYSEQADFPESAWCFVMKSSMYYYQPVDLENSEKFGTQRFTWGPADVKGAYLEAFGISL